MLPRRRLMLGLVVSAVVLLFYLSEASLWREYLFSPQLVVWDKRVWLVYARNPMLGSSAGLRVRPLQGVGERCLDAELGPVCVAGDFFVVADKGLAFYDASVLERGGRVRFGVALPSGWRATGLLGAEKTVYVGAVSDNKVGLFEVATRPNAQPRPVFVHKLTEAQIAVPVSGGESPLLVCVDGEGRIYIADKRGLRSTGLPRSRAVWAAFLKDRLHIFCVPLDSLYGVAEFCLSDKGFVKERWMEGRFGWLFGRRMLFDVNGCVVDDKPLLVAMFGSVVAVGDGDFRKVLGPSFLSRLTVLLYFGLLVCVIAGLVSVAFSKMEMRPPSVLPTAGSLMRVGAYLIDSLILAVVVVAVFYGVGAATKTEDLSLAFVVPLQILYFSVGETIFGRTVGKSIMGLCVVDERGGRASFAQILVRSVTRVVVIVEGPLLLFLGRRLGDWLSVSRVVVWRKEDAKKSGIRDKGMVSSGRGEVAGNAEGVDEGEG